MRSGLFKTHLFFNGAYQKLYRPGSTDNETAKGVGFGGRFEYGSLHLGAGGHYGRGLGLYYALEGGGADHADAWDVPHFKEFRTIDGYSIFAQYALGPLDINLAYGKSIVHLLDLDKCTRPATQMGPTEPCSQNDPNDTNSPEIKPDLSIIQSLNR